MAIGSYRGLKTISHGGGDAGYRSFVLWFPDQELGVAVISGLASFDSAGTARKVAEVFLGDKLTSEPAKPQQRTTQEGSTISGDRNASAPAEAADLEQYQGTYWSDELETQYTITLKGRKLTADHVRHGEIRLLSRGQDRFATTQWFMPEVIFLRDSSNRVSGLTLRGGRVTAIRFSRKGSAPAATPKP